MLEDPATPYTNLCGYVLGGLETYGPHEGQVLRLVKRYRAKKLCGEGGPEMQGPDNNQMQRRDRWTLAA